jgi:transposase-like protein
MSRKRFTAEQIIPKLREAEVELARGRTVRQVCKKFGVTEQTYYRNCLRNYSRRTRVCPTLAKASLAGDCWRLWSPRSDHPKIFHRGVS